MIILAFPAAAALQLQMHSSTHRPMPCMSSRTSCHMSEEPRTLEQFDENVKRVQENTFDGEPGTRGEEWVAGQAVLVLGVVIAPALPVADLGSVLGGMFELAGFALIGAGVVELGGNLSPWPKPPAKNELCTTGIFAACRHPVYGGLLATCFGFSLQTASYERLLFSCLLLLLITMKATLEEQLLEEKHGDAYSAWASGVPRFFPTLGGLQGSLDTPGSRNPEA